MTTIIQFITPLLLDYPSIHLCMRVYIRTSAPMPRRKHTSTIPTLMFHIFQRVDQVGYTAQAEACADDYSPQTMQILALSSHDDLLQLEHGVELRTV